MADCTFPHFHIFKIEIHCIDFNKILCRHYTTGRAGQLSQYSVWLRAGRPGDLCSIPGRGERIFPVASVSRPALGPTQPPVQGAPGSFPGAKTRRGRDADHSPPSSAEVENEWELCLLSPCASIGVLWDYFNFFTI
jgi:hypothetical protein